MTALHVLALFPYVVRFIAVALVVAVVSIEVCVLRTRAARSVGAVWTVLGLVFLTSAPMTSPGLFNSTFFAILAAFAIRRELGLEAKDRAYHSNRRLFRLLLGPRLSRPLVAQLDRSHELVVEARTRKMTMLEVIRERRVSRS